ncbi:MAG: hypothetical protein GEU88_08745 [Solirubrobacterales bacterium]|nr:hypothetical protein [Solirubrobacterales bacterium]
MSSSSRRPVSRGMRAFLYVAIALTFAAGTQLVVLAEHTDLYFAWAIDAPMSAAFIGASFWAASVVLLWAARQRHWVRARVPVPSVFVVATLLLIATLQHIEQFDGLLGALWTEVYAVVPPLAVALAAMQLFVPGTDPAPRARLPRGLRIALAVHAAVLLVLGALLYLWPGDAGSIWAWALTPLTAKAIGTWLLGIGTLAAYVAWRDDRADVPGASLAYIVLALLLALAAARFPDDLDFAAAQTWVFLAFVATAFAIGGHGALMSLREGRFSSGLPHGGVPVAVVGPAYRDSSVAVQGGERLEGVRIDPGGAPGGQTTGTKNAKEG